MAEKKADLLEIGKQLQRLERVEDQGVVRGLVEQVLRECKVKASDVLLGADLGGRVLGVLTELIAAELRLASVTVPQPAADIQKEAAEIAPVPTPTSSSSPVTTVAAVEKRRENGNNDDARFWFFEHALERLAVAPFICRQQRVEKHLRSDDGQIRSFVSGQVLNAGSAVLVNGAALATVGEVNDLANHLKRLNKRFRIWYVRFADVERALEEAQGIVRTFTVEADAEGRRETVEDFARAIRRVRSEVATAADEFSFRNFKAEVLVELGGELHYETLRTERISRLDAERQWHLLLATRSECKDQVAAVRNSVMGVDEKENKLQELWLQIALSEVKLRGLDIYGNAVQPADDERPQRKPIGVLSKEEQQRLAARAKEERKQRKADQDRRRSDASFGACSKRGGKKAEQPIAAKKEKKGGKRR